MVGGNTLSSHVIKMKQAARKADPARFKASRYLCEHQHGQKHSDKRLNMWLRIQTDLYGKENCLFLCNRISKFVSHSAVCSPRVPWCWIREKGLDWQEGECGKSPCWWCCCAGGPLLYPAPQGAQPQPRVGSGKTLCWHTELRTCVWAKEKAELAAVGFPWPEHLGSWDTGGLCLLHFTETLKGKCALVRPLPIPALGSRPLLEGHSSGFRISSQLWPLSLAEPLALC